MEETLEGGRGPPRAVVPLGMEFTRNMRGSTDIARKVAMWVKIFNYPQAFVRPNMQASKRSVKQWRTHITSDICADRRVLWWGCSKVSMQLPGAIFREGSVGLLMYSDTLEWRQYRTQLSPESRGYALLKRKDTHKEYNPQHHRPTSVFNKHCRLN